MRSGANILEQLSLGVLDYGPQLGSTLQLIPIAERSGYRRFWLTEHFPSVHGSALAMAGIAAAMSNRITVGTGGILLRYHVPYVAAQTFRALSSLWPGRIEAGFCAGGVARPLRRELAPFVGDASYPRRVEELVALTRNQRGGDGNRPPLIAHPDTVQPPSLWYLGSGDNGASIAARLGVCFGFALHFRHCRDNPDIVDRYRQEFVSDDLQESPRCCLSVGFFCSESQSEVDKVVRQNEQTPLLPLVLGRPLECREQLEALADRYQLDEILLLNLSPQPVVQQRSFQLLGEEVTR